jgi:hypothetical protein
MGLLDAAGRHSMNTCSSALSLQGLRESDSDTSPAQRTVGDVTILLRRPSGLEDVLTVFFVVPPDSLHPKVAVQKHTGHGYRSRSATPPIYDYSRSIRRSGVKDRRRLEVEYGE